MTNLPRNPWSAFLLGVKVKVGLLTILVVGAQWMLIDRFAGESPFGDQWDAEARQIYVPLLEGKWTWHDLLVPANEHRLLAKRLLDVFLFEATGRQWDPKVQLAASAVVHAFWLGFTAAWILRRLRPGLHGWAIAGFVTVGVLPLASDNILWAFQSQFYFLLLFATIAGWGLLESSPRRGRWWLGLGSGVIAMLTMGSGGLVGGAIFGVIILRAAKREAIANGEWTTLVAALALVAATWWWRVEVPQHAALRTDTLLGFLLACWHLLAWPFPAFIPGALVVWLPALLLIWHWSRRRTQRISRLGEAAFFIGGWALLQLAALAWLRGASLTFSPPPSRYLDLLLAGLLANLIALLAVDAPRRSTERRWATPVRGTWFAVVGTGLSILAVTTSADSLSFWRETMRAEVARLSFFIRTGDIGALKANAAWDAAAIGLTTLRGALGAALPPALQSVPPNGFSFEMGKGWEEGDLDPRLGPPGGYPAWSNASSYVRKEEPIDLSSTPFLLTRGAVTMSYAISAEWGLVAIEFVREDGKVGGVFLVRHKPGFAPAWEDGSALLEPGWYRLRVHDQRERGWVAISAPREMSALGYRARDWLARGSLLAVAGAAGLALLLTWPFRPINHGRPKRQ